MPRRSNPMNVSLFPFRIDLPAFSYALPNTSGLYCTPDSTSESPLGDNIPNHAIEILLTRALAYFLLESADRANGLYLTDWQTALREASNDTSLYPFWNNLSFPSCHSDEQKQPDEEGKEECHEQGNKDGQVLVEAEDYERKEENDHRKGGNSQEGKENEQQEEIEDEDDCDTDGEENYEDRDEGNYEEANDNCTVIKEDHYEEEEEDSYVEK
ncbi:hypothetical protein TTRE_0000947601 [Trichuris trichiura]|uniref:Uncharacterized protein n=1 Tax=Trichuris trichiura TaxID=36087 RepID=A0A077ZQK6_TRITR|nr:hypothetical protein TTRE_0000947601 [Trichuris trichiura]